MYFYAIVISYSVFFLDWFQEMKGNYSAALINHKNFRYWHKVIQVARKLRLYTVHMGYFFSFLLFSPRGEKEGS